MPKVTIFPGCLSTEQNSPNALFTGTMGMSGEQDLNLQNGVSDWRAEAEARGRAAYEAAAEPQTIAEPLAWLWAVEQRGEPMKNPAKALEFSLSLVEAIHHTGQADMIQAAEQSLAALLNGAVALRGMRREPSPRCAANVMESTRWLEKIPTRKAAARLGEQVNDELTIILSSEIGRAS